MFTETPQQRHVADGAGKDGRFGLPFGILRKRVGWGHDSSAPGAGAAGTGGRFKRRRSLDRGSGLWGRGCDWYRRGRRRGPTWKFHTERQPVAFGPVERSTRGQIGSI